MKNSRVIGLRLLVVLGISLLPLLESLKGLADDFGNQYQTTVTWQSNTGKGQNSSRSIKSQEPLGTWENIPVPVKSPLLSADFVLAADGWAVGAEKIIHWDGKNWISYDAPINWTPFTVKMLTSRDVWGGGYQGELAHWNGVNWQKVLVPARPDATMFGNAFLSYNQGWLVGGGGDPEQGVPTFASILRWDGKSWAVVTNPARYPLRAVAMLSQADGWAVGEMNEILHWDGQAWHSYHLLNHDDYFYNAIAMVSANDGWLIGEGVSFSQTKVTPSAGIILHWDGKEWKEFQQIRYALYSISMVTPSFGWAVGGNNDNNHGGSILLHWDGQAWHEYPSPTTLPLNFVSAQVQDDGWLFAGGISPNTIGEGSGVFRYVVKPNVAPTSSPTAPIILSTLSPTPSHPVQATPTLPVPIATLTNTSLANENGSFRTPIWPIAIVLCVVLILGVIGFVFYMREKK